MTGRGGGSLSLSLSQAASGLTGRARPYPQRNAADPRLFLRGKEVAEEGDAEEGFTRCALFRAGSGRPPPPAACLYRLEGVRLWLGRGSRRLLQRFSANKTNPRQSLRES